MPETANIFPPSPVNVPPELTAPSSNYRLRVILVFSSTAAFVMLYLGLTIGSGFLCYFSFATLGNKYNPILMSIIGLGSGLLFLFLVKGLFKHRRHDPSMQVEITEKEQPILFGFIRRLCQEAKTPLPHRVFLDPEVNACVFYNSSFLSLFLPTPKNLLIGLGLVNRLNLSEFKAVLAHEFGHFSQTSMKLGSYVYTSNRIIVDIVYARDWFDDLMAWSRRVGFEYGSKWAIAISVLGWCFSAGLWVLRLMLAGLFRVINFANSALSRQMEFNADLVAVSVTGSDALINALARLDFAEEALEYAEEELAAAGDHKLYTRDLFYHQTRAAEHLRAIRQDPKLGEPPPLSHDPTQSVQVFAPEDASVPLMWATHPTNYDREHNAKRRYIRCSIDQRSPWLLFHDPAAVRAQVTRRYYQVERKLRDPQLTDPEKVQKFIDDEHAETTYDERYHGMYDDRMIAPGDLDELMPAALVEFADDTHLADALNRLYGDELKVRMEAHREREQESELLSGLVNGEMELTGKDFPFRNARYRLRDAAGLLRKVEKELEEDGDWFAGLDRQVFLVHYAMARHVGPEARLELEHRYRFQLGVQEVLEQLIDCQSETEETLDQIEGKRKLTQVEFLEAQEFFRKARELLQKNLEAAKQLQSSAPLGITADEPIDHFLLGRPLLNKISWLRSMDTKWVDLFTEQLSEMLNKIRRIHFKNLGGILAFQERIAQQWPALRCQSASVTAGSVHQRA